MITPQTMRQEQQNQFEYPSDRIVSLIQFLVVFYVILRSGVVLLVSQGEVINFVDIPVFVGIILYVLLKRAMIPIQRLIILIWLVIWILISYWINSSKGLRDIAYLTLTLRLGLTFFVASAVPFASFRKYFVRIIVVVALISLVFYFLTPVLQSYYSAAPIIKFTEVVQYRNLGVWYLGIHSLGTIRNTGIFWEPGAYQIFLNLALLFILFDREREKQSRLLSTLILVVAVYTTRSTTGYVAMGLIFATYIIASAKRLSFRNVFLLLGGISAVVILSIIFIVQDEFIVGKFSEDSLGYLSYTHRLDGTLLNIEGMMISPIWGLGIGEADTSLDVIDPTGPNQVNSSNTFTSLGSSLGFFVMLFLIIQMFGITRYFTSHILSRLSLFVLFIILFSTELFVTYLLIYVLAWYSVCFYQPSTFEPRIAVSGNTFQPMESNQ